MYDDLSSNYDRFVNWQSRLAVEMPFLLAQIGGATENQAEPARVLDSACGTGMHAIALAKEGCQAAGADLSAPMIEIARANAAAEGVDVRFEAAGFGALAPVFGPEQWDSVLCLGNSLPHVLDPEGLQSTLADFRQCLRPGGLLLVQNRNFDLVLARRERWMEPQSHQAGQAEWIFNRFYDFDPDGMITFNMVVLSREGQGPWKQKITATRLRPLTQDEMVLALAQAGFTQVESYGDMAGSPFNPQASGNLILVCRA